MASIEELLVMQDQHMNAVSRALPNFKKLGQAKMTPAVTRQRLTTLKETFAKCQELHGKISFLADEKLRVSHLYFTQNYFIACEDYYNEAADYMADVLASHEDHPSPFGTLRDGSSLSEPFRTTTHLPRINLPTFDGSTDKWESFRDRFKSLVHNEPNLSNVNRMHYLCSSVKGEASKALDHLAVTDHNFDVAWKILVSRYDNKRRLITVHLQNLLNLPSVNSETSKDLCNLRDQTNAAIQALKNLDRRVEHWDDLLVFLVAQKLDKSTRKSWELKLGDSIEYPPYNELDQFLDARIRALDAIAPAATKHSVKECTSSYACKQCHKRHHSLLHIENFAKPDELAPVQAAIPAHNAIESEAASHLVSKIVAPNSSILLATARVRVYAPFGRYVIVRALLDQGSVTTLMTESLAQCLRLPKLKRSVSVTGVGDSRYAIRHAAQITITLAFSDGPAYSSTALILRSLTKYVPSRTKTTYQWHHVAGLQLADDSLMSSDPIDLIIDADLFGLLVLEGVRKGSVNEPTAQKTTLGWIISGPISPAHTSVPTSLPTHHGVVHEDLDVALRRFWEHEEIPPETHLSPEDRQCEEHFQNGTPTLGESRPAALASFLRLERRLQREPALAAEYRDFLDEYERLGHMIKAPPLASRESSQSYYIPHHAVMRDSSATTRLRVVFNASSRTTNGTSLNDHLLIGPKLQRDLAAVILSWRQHRYVYTADIAKMYRQIRLHALDVNYQRILWRPSPLDPIIEYLLLTVTYGTAAAAYIALRVLEQLAKDHGAQFPLAIPVLRDKTYVDDCAFGADDLILAR
ncbi:uncharacterized protein LOC143907758 [Temnothorax americanus]|uniref:uncharacterized protein LOC143907758 n=1 Tax=Temnothorax americanus TaxID=1964332 RepID=UPI004068D87E